MVIVDGGEDDSLGCEPLQCIPATPQQRLDREEG